MTCRQRFRFRPFEICQDGALMKINTDTLLCALLSDINQAERILEIGTGTGAVALLTAWRNSQATIDALEPHEASFKCAARNFKHSPYARRMNLYQLPVQKFKPPTLYDAIISNPPYFSAENLRDNPARDEEYLPLSVLTEFASRYLTPHGKLSFIYPADRTYDVLTAAYEARLFPYFRLDIRDRKDTPVKRTVWVFTPQLQRNFTHKTIHLFDAPGKPSEFYRNLTKKLLL